MIMLRINKTRVSSYDCDSCGGTDFNEDIKIDFPQFKIKESGCHNFFGTLCKGCREYLIKEIQ